MDRHFYIKNDHWVLKYLTDQKVSNLLQLKWISKLLVYNYTIVYMIGVENTVVDALNRVYEDATTTKAQ